MPVDTQQIMDEAAKLGELVKQHPAVARYKAARKAMDEDADASRLMADYERQIESLSRAAQSGIAPTDAQQQQLETLQNKIVSHIKVKSLNLAQVEFVDLLRRISQTIQRPWLTRPHLPGRAQQGAGRESRACNDILSIPGRRLAWHTGF